MTNSQKDHTASIYKTTDVDNSRIRLDITLALTSPDFMAYVYAGGLLSDSLDFHRVQRYLGPKTYKPDAGLIDGEFAVRTWSKNESVAKAALASGIFEDTGKRIPTGFVEAQVWRFKTVIAKAEPKP